MTDDIKNKIMSYLDMNPLTLDVGLKNNDNISFFKPNQEVNGVIATIIDFYDNGFEYLMLRDDGCLYKSYILYSEVSRVSCIYNCPTTEE